MKPILLITCLLINVFSYSQEIDLAKVPQIQTKATYTTEVQPDLITLTISLSENNTKGRITIEEMERKLESVLRANNIDIQKQLTLKDLSSNFQNYFLKKTDVLKSKNFLLEVYSAQKAGKILRDLADNDISNVRLVKTDYSKMEDLKIDLKGKAVAKARRQAEEMSKALNQKIGRAIFISDMETNIINLGNSSVNTIKLRGMGSNNAQQEDSDLDINFDDIRVDATVIVNFKLEQ